jgi:hypothetical protein
MKPAWPFRFVAPPPLAHVPVNPCAIGRLPLLTRSAPLP